ncbi:MAG: anaerobic glycerol-3-phosphate dehydrogenase subunit C [Desulfovibrionaceae bacterium]|nr:anaerobic glycerol-3-phosphate dehydrogenase subunit C [Desulfovibrionaceae bacterium]
MKKDKNMPHVQVDPDACIACTTCTVFCPVAAATGEFIGPKMIGPAYERFRLSGLTEDKSLSYCANCKNCDISCPQGVSIASINMVARAAQCEKEHPHFLRDWIVSHSETLGHLIGPVPADLKNWAMRNVLVRQALDVIGIAKELPMPTYAPKRFRQRLPKLNQIATGKTVAFFPGCYVDLYDPKAGEDLVWALGQAGYRVVSSPKFCCCGVPMVASGFMDDARNNARRNLEAMREFAAKGIPILTACPSCELMFREEIPTFFPELAEEGMPVVMDAQEFLLGEMQSGNLKLSLKYEQKSSFMYHAPCHMRALGIGLPGLELLREAGIEIEPANAGCCGISGSYGFKKEKHAVSMKVGSELFRVIRESGANTVATECGTCRLQIASATGVRVMHPVSMLRALSE